MLQDGFNYVHAVLKGCFFWFWSGERRCANTEASCTKGGGVITYLA